MLNLHNLQCACGASEWTTDAEWIVCDACLRDLPEMLAMLCNGLGVPQASWDLRDDCACEPVSHSGYTDCACRDCFEIAVSSDMAHPEMCDGCVEAGCEPNGDCLQDSTYGMEES